MVELKKLKDDLIYRAETGSTDAETEENEWRMPGKGEREVGGIGRLGLAGACIITDALYNSLCFSHGINIPDAGKE